jgi:diguanylate cyclase (GGDEF)-like protein
MLQAEHRRSGSAASTGRAMPIKRPMRAALLSLLYGVGGCFSLLDAARPLRPESPVTLGLAIGALALAVAAAVWWRGARLTDREVHAALVLAAVLVAALASRFVTAVGIVALGPVIITLCLYSGWFLPLPAARVQVGVTLLLVTGAALLASPTGFVVPWLVLVVTAAILTEIQGRLAEQLRRAATTDPLTGLVNRRAWEAEASRVLSHALRTREPVTIAVLDLDHFKEVNDRSGHEAGDALLRELTARWSAELREADLLGRYGGDEFVLCLPGTDAPGAGEILGRLAACHAFRWSAGTATAGRDDTLGSLLSRADVNLYAHKRSGRSA